MAGESHGDKRGLAGPVRVPLDLGSGRVVVLFSPLFLIPGISESQRGSEL